MTDRKIPTLKITGLSQHTFASVRRMFAFTAPIGTTEHDTQHPDFWRSIGSQLMRNDIIYLLAPDESWELELRVEKPGSEVEVSIARRISRVPVGGTVEHLDENHFVQYRGPQAWCVMRRARTDRDDPLPVVKGKASKGGALNEFYRLQPKKVA